MKKPVIGVVLALAALFLVFEAGRLIGLPSGRSPAFQFLDTLKISATSTPADVDLRLFWDVWNTVHEQYYGKDDIKDEELVYGAIKGMVRASGDKYGEFFTPEETKNFLEAIAGSFDGIGAEITSRDGQITIVAPLKDTPAERAGLKPGDLVLKINEDTTFEMSLERAVSLIKGPRGSTVTLLINRPELETPLEVSIVRAHIEVSAVESKFIENEPGLGYVAIRTFSETAPREFRQAVKRLVNQGLKRLIIDVRNDPGGVLDAAVEVASVILGPDKVIAVEKTKTGEPVEHKSVGDRVLAEDLPVVILVNGGTASASEILAGALRDLRSTLIIGEKTFGKGSVQSYAELRAGASVKITTAQWFTPAGESLEGNGLEPDVLVADELTEGTPDAVLNKALELIKQQ